MSLALAKSLLKRYDFRPEFPTLIFLRTFVMKSSYIMTVLVFFLFGVIGGMVYFG